MQLFLTRINKFLTLLFIAALLMPHFSLLASTKFSKGKIILIQHPENLFLLNKYKQKLSEEEQKLLLPYMPFVVQKIDSSEPLQLLLKTESMGKEYYIMLNKKKKFVTKGKLGEVKILSGYSNDSLPKLVLGQKFKITFYSIEKKRKTRIDITSPDEIKLIARRKNTFLVKTKLGIGTAILPLSLFHKKESATKLDVNTLGKIDSLFSSSNLKIKNLFSTLDSKNTSKTKIPEWKKAGKYKYLLKNYSVNEFENLKKYLLNKINLLLLNEGFAATDSANYIIIKPTH